MRHYYANNKNKMTEFFKSCYIDNYDKIRKRNRQFYGDHLEERREYARMMHLRKQKGIIKENGHEQCYKFRKSKGKQETEFKEDKGPVDKIVVTFG
jgi:hypothetical protein